MKTKTLAALMLTVGCNKIINLEYKNKNQEFIRKVRNAIISRNLVALSRLLEQMGENENLNILDLEQGQAPIHYVVSEGFMDALPLLLTKNIDIDLKNIAGQSALHIAAEHQNIAAIKLLLNSGASPVNLDKYGTTPLIANIIDGGCSLDIFNIFLPYINDINMKIGPQGKTLLHLVCERGNVEYAKRLLSLNAYANERDNSGKTPLHYAVSSFIETADMDLIETLIRAGADINIVDNSFENVQHLSISFGIEELIDFFDRRGLKRDTIEKSSVEKFISLVKSYGNIFIDDGRKEMIREALHVANIKTEQDFQENKEFVVFLALTFYMRWTNDKFCTSLPDSIALRNENIDDEEIDLSILADILASLKIEDLDKDLKNNSKSLVRNFMTKLNSIKNNTYNDGQGGVVTKRKLKILISMLSQQLSDKDKIIFIINNLLRQFTTCSTGLNAGLDQSLEFLGLSNQSNEDLDQLIAKKLHDLRKVLLLEVLNSTYVPTGQQVHFDLQVLKHFSTELKLEEPYSDIYNIRYNFDAELLRAKFWEKYNIETVLEVVRDILKNKIPQLFDYIESLSDSKKNLQLMECKIFFDDDNDDDMLNDETVKALLFYLGYIKKIN